MGKILQLLFLYLNMKLFTYYTLVHFMFYLFSTGSVGMPFPRVEACIAAPDVYSDKGYDVLAQGNCRRTKVKPGKESVLL